jgi:hypothetical protein
MREASRDSRRNMDLLSPPQGHLQVPKSEKKTGKERGKDEENFFSCQIFLKEV